MHIGVCVWGGGCVCVCVGGGGFRLKSHMEVRFE